MLEDIYKKEQEKERQEMLKKKKEEEEELKRRELERQKLIEQELERKRIEQEKKQKEELLKLQELQDEKAKQEYLEELERKKKQEEEEQLKLLEQERRQKEQEELNQLKQLSNRGSEGPQMQFLLPDKMDAEEESVEMPDSDDDPYLSNAGKMSPQTRKVLQKYLNSVTDPVLFINFYDQRSVVDLLHHFRFTKFSREMRDLYKNEDKVLPAFTTLNIKKRKEDVQSRISQMNLDQIKSNNDYLSLMFYHSLKVNYEYLNSLYNNYKADELFDENKRKTLQAEFEQLSREILD